MSTLRRLSAWGAAALGCAAMVGLLTAIAGTPGLRLRGYISELGAAGQPWAVTYRAAILALAVALALLALVVRPVNGLAAVPLGAAAPFAGVAGSVRCSPGCPLPPTEPSTPPDVVHATASIAAFVLAACAMLVLAWRAADVLIRRLCLVALTTVVAMGVPVAVGIVFVGRGAFTGVLERGMIAAAIAWLVWLAALLARRTPAAVRAGPAPRAASRVG
jgi:hypothetical protein